MTFQMSPLLIVLSVLAVFIFYRLYQLFGQKNVGLSIKIVKSAEDLREILEQNQKSDEKPQEHKEILRPQWIQLKQLDASISEQKLLHQFVDLFKKVHYTFATGQKMSDIAPSISDDVKSALEGAIVERGAHQYKHQFEGDPKCLIKEIHIQDKICSIETEIKSVQIIQIQDEHGENIDNPEGVAEDITDFWVFQRNYAKPGSGWVVMQMS